MGRTDSKAANKAPGSRHAAKSNSPSTPTRRTSKTHPLFPVFMARHQEGQGVERAGAKPWVDGCCSAFCCAPLSPAARGHPLAGTGLEPAIPHHAVLRIHGDRNSLLAALTAHWAEQQLQIPQPLRPVVAPINRWTRPMR